MICKMYINAIEEIDTRILESLDASGCNGFEKTNGQYFELDVDLTVDTGAVGETDDINDTVNYSSVIKVTEKAFTQNKRNTVECAAHDVARAVLAAFAPVAAVRVCLKKPDEPLKADFDYVAAEITVDRGDS